MLKKNNAKKIKIPYKENRAVIFNSKLFHCTDKYTFKNDFLSIFFQKSFISDILLQMIFLRR